MMLPKESQDPARKDGLNAAGWCIEKKKKVEEKKYTFADSVPTSTSPLGEYPFVITTYIITFNITFILVINRAATSYYLNFHLLSIVLPMYWQVIDWLDA